MVTCRFSRSMPPAKWVACVRRMASKHFAAGDTMYAPGSIGTSLVSAGSIYLLPPQWSCSPLFLSRDAFQCAQVFLESGKAVNLLTNGTEAPFSEGGFYGEDAFITTLSVMVEDNNDLTVEAAANTLRKDGLVAVTECHCLELSVRDVMDAFSNNSNVLRLLTRKLKLKADVEALGAPPSPCIHTAGPPSPFNRRRESAAQSEGKPGKRTGTSADEASWESKFAFTFHSRKCCKASVAVERGVRICVARCLETLGECHAAIARDHGS